MIYLDNAATTPMSDGVLRAMLPYMLDKFGNAGSVHGLGFESKAAIETARIQVARLFCAQPENIVFTSGGSEGNNFAFHMAREQLRETEKKHVIVSAVEHDSVYRAAESLTKYGFHVTFLPVNAKGSVEFDAFIKAITPETGFVSIMYVNNETGACNPIKRIGEYCKQNAILFHTDCVQAAGYNNIDVKEILCDFATVSSHKIHGPKGVGAIYIKDPDRYTAMICGGANQEYGLRGGTENVPGIVGFGKAAEEAVQNSTDTIFRVVDSKIAFWEVLHGELGETVQLNGPGIIDSYKILNITVEGVDSETLLLMLSSKGVYISAGSACCSQNIEPSRVLLAIGLTAEEARCSVRVSFSGMNTIDEACKAANEFVKCVRSLKMEWVYDLEE